jgi:hypothetical protein
VCTVVNYTHLIRNCEKNPFLHQKDWMVGAPIITVPLALVQSWVPPVNPPPPLTVVPEWLYAYSVPSDSLRIHQILLNVPARRTPYVPWRVPYVIRANNLGETGPLIFTNQANAVVEYTQQQTSPAYWPTDFVDTVGWRLAALCAPSLTGGDPFKLGQAAVAEYENRKLQAQANAMNEQQALPQPESSFVDTRWAGTAFPYDDGGWPIGPFP